MASSTTIQAGLEIQADVDGIQKIHDLSTQIEAAGGNADSLRDRCLDLANSWQQLQAQSTVIGQFKQLQQAIAETDQALAAAKQQSEALYQAWQADQNNVEAKQGYERQAQAVQALAEQHDNLKRQLNQSRIAINEAGLSVNQLSQAEQSLAQQSQQAQNALNQLTQEAEQLNRLAQARHTLGLDVDDAARKEIIALNQAFEDLKASGTLSQEELARAAELHREKINDLETSLEATKPTLMEIAEEMKGVIGSAGGLAYVTKEAISFETAMAGVKKVTDGTPEQYAALTNELKNMASELGIVPSELANMAAAGGQMGIAMEKLPEFARIAASMSVAFGISADAAGEAAAKIANVYQIPIEQVVELNDAINTLGNNTAAKESEIINVFTRIGGNAKQFGLAAEEASALGAAFLALGKPPEVAATAINAMLSKLQTAQVQGKGFQAALSDIGLSADEMAANIKASPQAALTDFLHRLEQVDQQSRAIILSKLFGAEYSDDLALLTGSLKTYTDALASATDRTQTLGAVNRELEAVQKTTAHQMEQAKASIAASAIDLGNVLLPVVQVTANAIGGIAHSLTTLTEQYPLLTKLAVLFAAGKIAVLSFSATMKLAGVEGSAAMLKTTVSMQKLKNYVGQTTASFKLLGSEIRATANADRTNFAGIRTALSGIRKSAASAVTLLGEVTLAFGAGLSVGSWLYESSQLTRTIGDNLARIPAMIESLWDTGSLEKYRQNFETQAEAERRLRKEQEATAKANQARAEAEKRAATEQATRIQALQERHRALQREYTTTTGSLNTLKNAGRENSAMYADLANRAAMLEIQLKSSAAELGKMNAQISDASPLAAQRKALEDLGLTAEQVQTGISDKAQKALADFGQAASVFANDTDQMQRIFEAAMHKMDSPEAVEKLKESLRIAGKEAGISAEKIEHIADTAKQTADKVAEAFAKIGVDTQSVMTGISQEAQTAMHDFGEASRLAKEQGVANAKLIAASFEEMMSKLKSPEEFAAFKAQLKQSGDVANLTTEQIERLNAAVKQGAIAAKTAYANLENSLKTAADTTAINAAGQAAETAMKRGEISAAQYQEVLKQVAERTREVTKASETAGHKTAQANQADTQAVAAQTAASQANAQANQASAKASEQSAKAKEKDAQASDKAAQSTATHSKQLSEFAQNIGVVWRELEYKNLPYDWSVALTQQTRQASGAWAQYVKQMWQLQDDVITVIKNIDTATSGAGNTAYELAKAEQLAAQNARKLDESTLNKLTESIDKAREKMRALAEEAAESKRSLEKELASVTGDTEKAANLEQADKLAKLKAKQQTAQKQGNQSAASDYAQAIALQEQIYQAQKRQRDEQAQQQRKQAAEQAQQQERESNTIAPVQINLPESPTLDAAQIDLSSIHIDTTHLAEALQQRDADTVAQIQSLLPELVQKLMPQIANELLNQLNLDAKRTI